jgi:hypothetical protein
VKEREGEREDEREREREKGRNRERGKEYNSSSGLRDEKVNFEIRSWSCDRKPIGN